MTAMHIPSHLAGLTFEEEATFGTDPASSPTRLRMAQNIVFKPEIAMHPVETQKSSDMRGPDNPVVGGKGGTLTFDVPLYTNGGSESEIVSLLKRMGATVVSVAQETGGVVAGSGAGNIKFADGDVGNIAVGVGILHNPASGTSSIRFVEHIEPDDGGSGNTTCTMNANWATTPLVSDSWEALDTIRPQAGEPDKYFSFTVYQGHGSTDRLKWVVSGCSGTWTINSTDANGLPIISFEFKADNWTDSEANLAQTDAAGNAPNPLLGDSMMIDGTDTATKSIAFDPGLELSEIPATSGSHGRSGHFFTKSEPKLEISPLHDTDWIGKFEAGTTFDFCFESLTSDTDAWALWCPEVQVNSYGTEDSEGLLRGSMDLVVCDPETNADDEELPLWALAITK